ncbi:MAG: hypothetical protein VYA30_04340 [Myxococcota bacterium]|nr:hypothetical protein [Myxococcota bacterium]
MSIWFGMPTKEPRLCQPYRAYVFSLLLLMVLGCHGEHEGDTLIVVDAFVDATDGAGHLNQDTSDSHVGMALVDMAVLQDAAAPLELGQPELTSLSPTQPAAIQGDLAFGSDGRLGMAWCGMGDDRLTVWFSSLDSGGQAIADPVALSAWTSGQENEPVICPLAAGGFAVAWAADTGGAQPNLHVRYRLVSSDGVPEGVESRRIGDDALGNHWLPSISCHATGGFVVVGVSAEVNGTFGIFHASVDASGELISLTRANEDEQGSQLYPSVAVDRRTDRSLVVWEHHFDDMRPSQLRGRWFSSDGMAQASEFNIGPVDIGLEKPAVEVAPDTGDALILGHIAAPRLFLYRLADGQSRAVPVDLADSDGSYLGALSAYPGSGFALLRLNGLRDDVGMMLSILDGTGTVTQMIELDRQNLPPYTPAVHLAGDGLAALWTVRLPERAYGMRLARLLRR